MKKIVQLDETDYNELLEKANYNEEMIEAKAKDLYLNEGIPTFKILIEFEKDYYEIIEFNVRYCYLSEDNKFYNLPYEDARKICRYAERKIRELAISQFGQQINDINLWNKRLKLLRNWKLKFIGLTIFGWLAAVGLVVLYLIK
jgi:hypothetical protein